MNGVTAERFSIQQGVPHVPDILFDVMIDDLIETLQAQHQQDGIQIAFGA